MDNHQNIYQNNKDSTENSKMQLQLKTDDFYNYGVSDNDGSHYTLAIHKSAPLLFFAKIAENKTESEMGGHCIWVDANSRGRYQILDQDHADEVNLVPAEFVRGKYTQAMYYFSRCEDVKNKVQTGKPGAEELISKIDLHLIRLVKLLIHDLESIEHIARAMDSKLKDTIRNIIDNKDNFIRDLMKDDDEWSYLKFNGNSYYLDESDDLQENDDVFYHMAFHKTLKHVIFTRATGREFKTSTLHHLYISEDDGLGRYKVQTEEGEISKRLFVPANFVAYNYNQFIEIFDDFKELQDISDAYSRQTMWCKLQDDAIYLMNQIQIELENDLKQDIDKSLDHYVMSLASSIRNPNNFDDFYSKVIEREKRIRLQNRENTCAISLIIFNKHNRTSFIIHINNFENDIFYVKEKIGILISKYDSDYYVLVAEGWEPKNHEIDQGISPNYRYGDINKLPSYEKTEILTFIGKSKNSGNRRPDKSEVYEIIRDEKSRILELRKLGEGRLDFTRECSNWV